MTNETDHLARVMQTPAFQRMAADARREEEAQRVGRRPALLADLAEAEQERTRLLPMLGQATQEAEAEFQRAKAKFNETGLRQHAEESRLSGRAGSIRAQLAEMPPRTVIEAVGALDLRIEAERTRTVPVFATEACEAHLRALLEARDGVTALASYADAAIPGHIEAILARIPARPEGRGDPPPPKNFIADLWQSIKDRGPAHTWAGRPIA